MPRSRGSMIVLALVALAVVGCTPGRGPVQDGTNPAPNPGAPQKVLVIAIRGEPSTLAVRALVSGGGGGVAIPGRFFNATLDVYDVNQNSHPQLAEALPQINTDTWRVFSDGRMETRYRLRPGLTWHDGAALTPEDFAFALRVHKTPEHGSSSINPIPQMDEIVAEGPLGLLIRWKQPYVDAAAMSISFQALPRHILEQDFQTMHPIAFTGHPFWTSSYVGLGPYKLDRWEPGAFLEGSAFDNHALGRPKIDRMRIQIINDPQTTLASVLAGEVHFVTNFTFSVDHGLVLEERWVPSGGGRVQYSPTQETNERLTDPAGHQEFENALARNGVTWARVNSTPFAPRSGKRPVREVWLWCATSSFRICSP